ncbi:MAG TPA: flagellar brake protein [Rhodocyclaceae bacterium]|nr:flagellar brake protein [Rhodocyclaceae bacterium]
MSPNDAPQQQESEPVHFELEQHDLYGKYMLTTPLDILFILRSLVKRGCMATVYFNHGHSFFLTSLLAIGKDEKSIILDIGSDQAANRDALKADRLIVTANLDNVKIQFALAGVREAAFDNRPAFVAAVPPKLLRLQRREYFRLETSLSNPVRCQVTATRADGSVHDLDLTLLDISGGGLSLMAPTQAAEFFQAGVILANSRLQIPGETVIVTNLAVRSAFRIVSRGGQEYLRIGCEYVNLPGARLNVIQRYITRIERERKAREIGLD